MPAGVPLDQEPVVAAIDGVGDGDGGMECEDNGGRAPAVRR